MASSSDFTMGFNVGNDPPADPATMGYTMNHFCLLTHDLAPMLKFYREALGMRLMFSYKAAEDFTFVYLGYPHGGPNANEHQSGGEMLATKGRREGLLEIVEVRWQSGGFETSGKTPNSFSHVGINVPDIRQTEERMRESNVAIIKEVGAGFDIKEGDLATNAFGLSANIIKARQALAGAASLAFDQVLLVADPDGNLVELQQIAQ